MSTLTFIERYPRLTQALQRTAFLTFALYLTFLLGTTTKAEGGGPLIWLSLWRLPTAHGAWTGIGVVSLLPVLSVIAWLSARAASHSLGALTWGWKRVAWPLAALAVLGMLRTLLPCLSDSCNVTATLRLLLLLAHLAWIYLYVVNEKPPLLEIIAAVVLIQSTVAIGQFIGQHDLGLKFLGESQLDPETSGVSVVMRGSERWLRAYGLTSHPNELAGTLITMLLMLPVLGPQPSQGRRLVSKLVFALGFAALLTTLGRWAGACLLLGLGINALPWLADSFSKRHRLRPPVDGGTILGPLLILVLFLIVYGNTIVGRAVALDTPVESLSLWERERDTQISLRIISSSPIIGVGVGNYVPAALEYDIFAKTVHNIPLLMGAELGLGGVAVWLWLVIAPLLRRDALSRFAPETGLWLGFWLLGLLSPRPYPLYELRSALLAGLVAGLVAQSAVITDRR